MTPGWPLSAPATALLRSLRTSEGELLRLGIRHLVLVGAWRLTAGPRPPKRLFRRPARKARLYAASGPVPPALARLDGALRAGLPSARSSAARHVVHAGLAGDRGVVGDLWREALRDLLDAGLVLEQPLRSRGSHRGARRTLTPAGRAARATARSTHAAWKKDLRAGGERARAVVEAAAASPGLLLTADSSLLTELDHELRRLRPAKRSDGGSGGDGGSGAYLTEVGGVDDVPEAELHRLLDGCSDLTDGLKGLGDLDFGISDGGGSGGDGGGGDGGGGDGGGGGGDGGGGGGDGGGGGGD